MASIIEALQSVSLFSDYPEDALEDLSHKVESLSLPQDTILFKEGDEGDGMYFIVQGKVSIFGTDEHGHEVLFDELGRGEYFGEMSLLDGKPRSAGARTLIKTEMLKLRSEEFSAVINRYPALALKLVNEFTTRLRDNVQILEAASAESTEELKLDEPKSDVKVRVFVSYSRRDKDFVRKLHESLIANGLETWVDWEGIPLGTDWWQEIVEGIQGCDNFLFVISPDSVASKVCADELQTAIDNNKRLVPVLIREEKGMVTQIRAELQAINFTFMRTDEEFEAMLPGLLTTLGTDVAHLKTHTRLQNLALEWERKNRSNSLALRGEELENAENWLAHASGKQPTPSALQGEFIQASRKDASRRQRQFLTGVVTALVISLVLAVVAAISFVSARRSQQLAEISQFEAQTAQVEAEQNEAFAKLQQATAEAASNEALIQKDNAQREAIAASTAEAKAVEQREDANQQRSFAEQARQSAEAQRLASQAEGDLSRGSLLTRSILLAIASMQKSRNFQADLALRVGLDILPSRLYVKPFLNPIVKVLYSPDGHWLAIAEYNEIEQTGHIEIWDSIYGNKISDLEDVGKITDMVFTPDGASLITASEDSTARIWNPENGEEGFRLQHNGPVRVVAVSLNGNWLATGGDDQYARAWNIRTGRQVAGMYHTAAVTDVDFSPGGSWIVSAGKDGAAIVWITTTGVENLTFYHDGEVDGVLFGPPRTLWMATATKGGAVTVWNPQNGARLAQLSHENDVVGMASSPDGKYLVTGSLDHTARIWEAQTGKAVAQLRHDEAVLSVAFSSNGNWVATGSADNTARVWDARTGRELARMEHFDAVNTLAFTPNGLLLTTGSQDKNVRVWSPEEVGQAIVSLLHPARVIDLDFNPDETLLATAAGDRKVRIWQVKGVDVPAIVQTISVDGDIIDVDFSRDGTLIATGSADGVARIWDAVTGELVIRFPTEGSMGEVLDVDFSRDGLWLVTGSGDGTARIWALETGEQLYLFQHGGDVGEVSLRSDGSQLATASLDKTARVWDVETETATQRLEHPDGVFLVNFVSQTNWLVTVSHDNVVRFWDDVTGDLIDRFFVDSEIRAIEISSDGTKLAITGDDSVARVWEIQAAGDNVILTEVSRVIHLNIINDVVYGAEGNQIATASDDRTVLISLLIPDELIDKACSRLIRNLTQLEWVQFFEGEIYERTCPDLPPDAQAIEALKTEVGQLGANGDFVRAVDLMRHIQELDPSVEIDIASEIRRLSIDTILNLGIVEAQEGEFELAYGEYLKIQTFDNYDSAPTYMDFLGKLCISGGSKEAAERALPICNIAIANLPGDYALYEARAVTNAWEGDFGAAIDDLEQTIELFLEENEEISEEDQFLLALWSDWINQLNSDVNPFIEVPPSN